jgi:hypothetical protein
MLIHCGHVQVIRVELRAICILFLHRWQGGLQNNVFFSHPLDSLLWFALERNLWSFNTAEVLSSVLIENLRTRRLVKLCGQLRVHRTASTCIGQLESTILVSSKRLWRLYTALGIAGFLGFAHRQIIGTERRLSGNGFVPVFRLKAGRCPSGSFRWKELREQVQWLQYCILASCCVIFPSPQ